MDGEFLVLAQESQISVEQRKTEIEQQCMLQDYHRKQEKEFTHVTEEEKRSADRRKLCPAAEEKKRTADKREQELAQMAEEKRRPAAERLWRMVEEIAHEECEIMAKRVCKDLELETADNTMKLDQAKNRHTDDEGGNLPGLLQQRDHNCYL